MTPINENGNFALIKYNSKDKIEWAKILATYSIEDANLNAFDKIMATEDQGYIVSGKFIGTITLKDGEKFETSNNGEGRASILLKYNKNNELEWCKTFDQANQIKISQCSNNDELVVLVFYGDYFQLIKYKDEDILWSKEITMPEPHPNGGGNFILTTTANNNIVIAARSVTIVIDNKTKVEAPTSANGANNIVLVQFDENGEVIKYNSEHTGDASMLVATDDLGYVLTTQATYITNENGTSKYISEIQIIKYSSDGEEKEKEILINSTEAKYFVKDGFIRLQRATGGIKGGIIYTKFSLDGKPEWSYRFENPYVGAPIEEKNGNIFAYVMRYVNQNTTGSSGGTNLKTVVTKLNILTPVEETSEVNAENYLKEFNITTSVKEMNGIKGGTISGESLKSYEKVIYNNSNQKNIVMTPFKDYEIFEITVNSKKQKFEVTEDGSYIMPTFENITEDKHIEVTYTLRDNKFTINKVDEDTKQALEGAEFEVTLEEIDASDDMRDAPVNTITLWNNEKVLNQAHLPPGTVVTAPNGRITGFVGWDTSKDAQNVVYKVGETIELQNDLNLYAVIMQTAIWKDGYTDTQIQSMNVIRGSDLEKLYPSVPLHETEGYVFKGWSVAPVNSNNEIIITAIYEPIGTSENSQETSDYKNENDIISEQANVKNEVYSCHFEKDEKGVYKSGNKGKENTNAVGYVPLNLSEFTGKFNLTINAGISSESSDYGNIIVTTIDINKFDFNNLGEFVGLKRIGSSAGTTSQTITTMAEISGEVPATDYTLELEGGKIYNIIFSYKKNESEDAGEDTFTINSIKVMPNSINSCKIKTSDIGKAITELPFGKYTIKETKAPQGYVPIEKELRVEFTSNPSNRIIIENPNRTVAYIENGEYTIENEKFSKVIVHHYLKDRAGNPTEIKLVEDELLEGKIGDNYTALPHIDFQKYELEKGIDGEYIIPTDYMGTFDTSEKHVTYYYVEKQIPLTVHHYIEGTVLPVPLKDGTEAEDITDSGYEEDNYTTNAISNEELSDEYELVEIPSNSEGKYSGNEVIVTYYYKKIQRNVNIIKKDQEDGIPLKGAKFTIIKTEEATEGTEPTIYTTDEKGKIEVMLEAGEYEITEIEAPEGYTLPENPILNIVITRETTEENLEISNEKIKGKVIVKHLIKWENTPVKLNDGTFAKNEEKTGYLGAIFATKAREDISEEYEFDSVVGQTSGEYTEETIVITYYYKTLINVDVVKKWNHTNNKYEKPESITVELYADEEKIKEKILTAENKIVIEGEAETEETWEYTFEKLPKYNEEGQEITYTILEKQ